MDRPFRVDIKDENGNFKWGFNFATYNEALEWASEQIKKPGRTVQPFEEIIKDLNQNPEWKIKSIQEKRKSEYPPELDIIEALLEDKEGRPGKLIEIMEKRIEIKNKYPIDENLRGKK